MLISLKKILKIFRGNFSSILLVIILFFNIFGFYYYFNYLQDNIRREIRSKIREGLKENELSLIEINDQNQADLIWVKQDKEFTYHGNLYDVVRKTLINGKTVYYCINDIKEFKLIRDFAKKAGHSHKSGKILNSYSTIFIGPGSTCTSVLETLDLEYYTLTVNLPSKIKEIADPPPKGFL